MIVTDKITDNNMDQIELEIKKKTVSLKRKLWKMNLITIKVQANGLNFYLKVDKSIRIKTLVDDIRKVCCKQ